MGVDELKIAFYTDYPPYEEKGGAEIRIDRLSKMLSKRDNEVHIFCGGKRRAEEKIDGVHYHIYTNYWELLPMVIRNIVYVFQTYWRFLFFGRKIRDFEIVDAYRPLLGSSIRSFAGSGITGFRNNILAKKLLLIPLILLDFFSAKFTKNIIAVSNAVKKDLIRVYGVDGDKIFVTYSGTDEEFLNANSEQRGNPVKISAVKGAAVLEGIDEISGIPHSEVLEKLKRTQIFVHYSRADGLPMSVREAMAVGLPVVATRVGGIPELIDDGKDGYLIDFGDYEGLRKIIDYLSEHPEVRRKIGERAKEKIRENFTWERCLNLTLSVYNKVGGAKNG